MADKSKGKKPYSSTPGHPSARPPKPKPTTSNGGTRGRSAFGQARGIGQAVKALPTGASRSAAVAGLLAARPPVPQAVTPGASIPPMPKPRGKKPVAFAKGGSAKVRGKSRGK